MNEINDKESLSAIEDEDDFKYSRQFGYNDTLILFGRSPFINTIKDKVPLLIKKYHTIGCNYFCETFPDVENVIFTDDIAPKIKDSTIITWDGHFSIESHLAHNAYPDNVKKELYACSTNIGDYPICRNKNYLYSYIHTPAMALNWAYHKGFKNVVIAGIDLDYKALGDKNKAKLNDFDNIKDEERFAKNAKKPGQFTKMFITLTRRHLMDVNEEFLNLYQLNPDSDIDIPKISIDKLL